MLRILLISVLVALSCSVAALSYFSLTREPTVIVYQTTAPLGAPADTNRSPNTEWEQIRGQQAERQASNNSERERMRLDRLEATVEAQSIQELLRR